MKFHRDPLTEVTIRQVEPGSIKVGKEILAADFALTAEQILREFYVPPIRALQAEHLELLLDAEPEMLIIGTGYAAEFAPRELVFAMARRGIGIETMDTPAACRTFNILIAEGRRPAAIIKVR
jgi:uncharacterized protein